jgi:hypothetical protein
VPLFAAAFAGACFCLAFDADFEPVFFGGLLTVFLSSAAFFVTVFFAAASFFPAAFGTESVFAPGFLATLFTEADVGAAVALLALVAFAGAGARPVFAGGVALVAFAGVVALVAFAGVVALVAFAGVVALVAAAVRFATRFTGAAALAAVVFAAVVLPAVLFAAAAFERAVDCAGLRFVAVFRVAVDVGAAGVRVVRFAAGAVAALFRALGLLVTVFFAGACFAVALRAVVFLGAVMNVASSAACKREKPVYYIKWTTQ